jgi:hypothetical protein
MGKFNAVGQGIQFYHNGAILTAIVIAFKINFDGSMQFKINGVNGVKYINSKIVIKYLN